MKLMPVHSIKLKLKDRLCIEVPMDADDKTYRDLLSQAQQGLIDSGECILVNEQKQMVDIDSPVPKESAQGEPPTFSLERRSIDPPKIRIGNYRHLMRRPLFCFLTGTDETAQDVQIPVECLLDGGFAVVHFRDPNKLKEALSRPERLACFDMVGLVADAAQFEHLWDIRQKVVEGGVCEGRKLPFACACYCGRGKRRAGTPSGSKLAKGIIPAPLDLSLVDPLLGDPSAGVVPFCEHMIYTLHYDGQLDPALRQPDAKAPEMVREKVTLQNEAFYADAGEPYTELLKKFAHEFREGLDRPDPSDVRRLIAEDAYFGQSKLVDCLPTSMAGYIKKIIDLGRDLVAGLAIT